jgi:hypothetical protein
MMTKLLRTKLSNWMGIDLVVDADDEDLAEHDDGLPNSWPT